MSMCVWPCRPITSGLADITVWSMKLFPYAYMIYYKFLGKSLAPPLCWCSRWLSGATLCLLSSRFSLAASVALPVCLSVHLSVCLSVCLSVSVCSSLSERLSLTVRLVVSASLAVCCLLVQLPAHLSVCLSVYLSLSVCLSALLALSLPLPPPPSLSVHLLSLTSISVSFVLSLFLTVSLFLSPSTCLIDTGHTRAAGRRTMYENCQYATLTTNNTTHLFRFQTYSS